LLLSDTYFMVSCT